jgi:hypothetical protein
MVEESKQGFSLTPDISKKIIINHEETKEIVSKSMKFSNIQLPQTRNESIMEEVVSHIENPINNNDNLILSATNEISSSQLMQTQFINHKIPKQH